MERTYQAQLYEAQGRASMLGLFALVDSLGQLPGRKTVFYFCEGLTIPDSQQARYRRSSTPPTATTSASTRSTPRGSASTAPSSRPPARCGSSRSRPWGRKPQPDALTQNLETNERLLKMDPAVRWASSPTRPVGSLDNTNALDRAVDRINDDRRHHYLLSYVSTNPTLDGTYRKIDVRVARPESKCVRVAATAHPPRSRRRRSSNERPAMAALAASPTPSAFPSRPGPAHADAGRPGLVRCWSA